jgi:hypothetical protein
MFWRISGLLSHQLCYLSGYSVVVTGPLTSTCSFVESNVRPRCIYGDNIRMNLRKIWYEGVDCIHLYQDWD